MDALTKPRRGNAHFFSPSMIVTWGEPNAVIGAEHMEKVKAHHGAGPFTVAEAVLAETEADADRVGHRQSVRLAHTKKGKNCWFSGAFFKPMEAGGG
jgi:hypothetical protein